MVESVAAMPAMNNDLAKAANKASFSSKAPYHFTEKPDQTDDNLPALKLKAIITSTGIYKSNKAVMPKITKSKGTDRTILCTLLARLVAEPVDMAHIDDRPCDNHHQNEGNGRGHWPITIAEKFCP